MANEFCKGYNEPAQNIKQKKGPGKTGRKRERQPPGASFTQKGLAQHKRSLPSTTGATSLRIGDEASARHISVLLEIRFSPILTNRLRFGLERRGVVVCGRAVGIVVLGWPI